MEKIIADLEQVLSDLKAHFVPAVAEEVDTVVDTVAPEAVTESTPAQ